MNAVAEHLRSTPIELAIVITMESNKAMAPILAGRVGMPPFYHLTQFEVAYIPPIFRPKVSNHSLIRTMRPDDLENVAILFQEFFKDYGLTTDWTPQHLAALLTNQPDFSYENFSVAEQNGRIVAAVSWWDQSNFKRTIVEHFGGRLKTITTLLKPLKFLPAEGEALRELNLRHIVYSDGFAPAARDIVRHLIKTKRSEYPLFRVGFQKQSQLSALFSGLPRLKVNLNCYVAFKYKDSESPKSLLPSVKVKLGGFVITLKTLKKTSVISNLQACGGKARRRWLDFLDQATQAGYSIDFHVTEYHGHATELARERVRRGDDRVIIFGGDGTLNEALNGLLEKDKPINPDVQLVYLTGGSSCDVAKLFVNQQTALQRIGSKAKSYKVDVCKVECLNARAEKVVRYFLANSSIGIISRSIEKFNQKRPAINFLKRINIDLAAVSAGVKTIQQFENMDARAFLTITNHSSKKHSRILRFLMRLFWRRNELRRTYGLQ
jgi:diacylglycerol kinase family enzyme